MLIGDTCIGTVFQYNGAIFVAEDYNWEESYYPYLCLAARNHKYTCGEHYVLNENDKTEKLITEAYLKSFIPKDVDYEMK